MIIEITEQEERLRIEFEEWAEIRFPELDVVRIGGKKNAGKFSGHVEVIYAAWRGGYAAGKKAQTREKSSESSEVSGPLPDLMDQKTLAAYLGKSTAWCERARWCGEGPRFVKLGRHVRYRADDVMAWIEENAKTRTE